MDIVYDQEADAVYTHLAAKPYHYGSDLDNERRVDYASDNTPIGVELLSVSWGVNVSGLPYAQEISNLLGINGIRAYFMPEYERIEAGYSEKPVIFSDLPSGQTGDVLEEMSSKIVYFDVKSPVVDQTVYVAGLPPGEVTVCE